MLVWTKIVQKRSSRRIFFVYSTRANYPSFILLKMIKFFKGIREWNNNPNKQLYALIMINELTLLIICTTHQLNLLKKCFFYRDGNAGGKIQESKNSKSKSSKMQKMWNSKIKKDRIIQKSKSSNIMQSWKIKKIYAAFENNMCNSHYSKNELNSICTPRQQTICIMCGIMFVLCAFRGLDEVAFRRMFR